MRRRFTVLSAGLAVAAVSIALSGCVGAGTANGDADASAKAAAPRTLHVSAAASLTATFTELGTDFEKTHTGVTVAFDFDGSSTLVTQLAQGAPADVFASADTKNMDNAVSQSLIAGDPVDFATNVLEIATPPGNPAHIATFADLARPGVRVVTCAPGVPCGNATAQVTKNTGIVLKPVSQEQSVTNVLAKVESGDADAGLVYVTDVAGAGAKVTGVPFPEAQQVVNTYPIAVTENAAEGDLAQQFLAFVTGTDGQAVLKAAGFGAPQK